MHRAESILEAVKTTLTGLDTTGNNVARDRFYPPVGLPALSIDMGAESENAVPTLLNEIQSTLEFSVAIYCKAGNPVTQANQIKAEVFAAMQTSNRLSLPYVSLLKWRGDEAPELSGDTETKTVKVMMNFICEYTHSLASKES